MNTRLTGYQPASYDEVQATITWMRNNQHVDRHALEDMLHHGYWPSTEYIRWVREASVGVSYSTFRKDRTPAFMLHGGE